MAALRRLAAAREKSLAELVRTAVDEMVARSPEHDDQSRARALAVVGRFESGRRDVSRNHDEHLAEAFRR